MGVQLFVQVRQQTVEDDRRSTRENENGDDRMHKVKQKLKQ